MKLVNYFVWGLIVISFFSCEKKALVPNEFITPEYVYNPLDSSGQYAEMVLNNLYTFLPDGYNRVNNVVLAAATDDAIPSDEYHTIDVLSKATLTAINTNPDERWYSAYEAIKSANVFLYNLETLPITPTTKRYWRSEARFIRAINYFELIKRYGGVPIVGNRMFSPNDKANAVRSNFQACVQYIIDEIDEFKNSLRDAPVASANLGRITKGAAMALKSRVLLYAASPLNNQSNDLNKWLLASDAAKEVIDYGQFSLGGDFASVFTDRESKEIILAYQRAKTKDIESLNAPVGYSEPNKSQGYVSPTQELVDAFPMKNGLSIENALSGYDPDFPYLNRDPRLDATVFHNGSLWLMRTVETTEGGLDKPNSIQRQTRTGYYMKKFLADYSSKEAYGNENHNFPIFRYAEVLLNYAEAENELGNINHAYDVLKDIRKRAGIEPGGDNMYGLADNLSVEKMREVIHNERRIEMAFEEQRFWDVRRWEKAEDLFNKELHGIKIKQISFANYEYEIVPVSKMSFNRRMNLYPIPFNESNGQFGITQNPGW